MDSLVSGVSHDGRLEGPRRWAGDKSSDNNGEAPEDEEDRVGEEAKLESVRGETARATKIGATPHIQLAQQSFRCCDSAPAILWLAWLKHRADDIFSFVNETALFKGQWQFKRTHGT